MSQPTATTPACNFPEHPGPAGHINACQLCPASPTYWRNQPTTDAPKPCQWTPSTAGEVKP